VIPVRPCDGDSVWYVRQTVLTNNAAPVAAGEEKPKSVITVERVEAPVRVIAHVSEALDRSLLSDAEQLVSFIDSEMRLGVLLAEEDQILNGNGTPPNLRGILNTVGVQTQAITTETIADVVFKAITKVRLAFFEPDAIVLHPNDFEDVRLSKAAGGDEQHLSAPITAEDPDRLWGIPVITSPVIAEGTGLVGAFAAGSTVWDRETARVTFAETGLGDNAGEELFTRNLVRYRVEERIAFSVERPAAFCLST